MKDVKQCCLCGGTGHDSKDCGMRAEFEAAFKERFPTAPLDRHSLDSDEYDGVAAAWTWWAWQAARAQPAEHVKWEMDSKSIRLLAAELIRAAKWMGDDETEFVLEVRAAGTVKDDDDGLNAGPILAIFDGEYPEEGVYPIDPNDPTAGRESEAAQPAGEAVAWDVIANRAQNVELADLTLHAGMTRKERKDAFVAAIDGDTAQPAQVPDGWQLVPVDLDAHDEITDAACEAGNLYRVDFVKAWHAALAAAPQPKGGE